MAQSSRYPNVLGKVASRDFTTWGIIWWRNTFWFLTSISRNRKMKVNEIQEIKCTKTQADYPMLLCGHNGDGVCGNCRCEPQHGEQLVQWVPAQDTAGSDCSRESHVNGMENAQTSGLSGALPSAGLRNSTVAHPTDSWYTWWSASGGTTAAMPICSGNWLKYWKDTSLEPRF